MDIKSIIEQGVQSVLNDLYGSEAGQLPVSLQATRKEFEGDFTVVTFPYTKFAKGAKPLEIGQAIGEKLQEKLAVIADFNVIQGFLNLSVAATYWRDFLLNIYLDTTYGQQPDKAQKVMVEYSSPNTNKPLHLGHIRNNLLGYSVAKILAAAGYEVFKVQVINDRGIAICKSMLAWQLFGEGATPASSGQKADHFVGHYYVLFEQKFQAEYAIWQQSEEGKAIFAAKAKEGQSEADFFKTYKNNYFNEGSELGQAAKKMLLNWEKGEPDTVALWKKMNAWVYEGFEETYQRLGVSFDRLYYESETYLLGKDIIEKGLAEGVFYTKEDGSTWVDLRDVKLDEKAVLRSDGTSLYITQDLGTARLRYEDFGVEKMVYVVADEQNYHFQVLFEILKKLKEPYAEGMYHLNYGMVDLPSGRMKSREGTVVDADDLMNEVIEEARLASQERSTTSELSEAEQQKIINQIGLAALKYFIIKVNPKKRMIFDPKESVDMQGQTGPYIQNAYVRTRAVQRKAGERSLAQAAAVTTLNASETELINHLYRFPSIVVEAADTYDPSLIANFCYDLAKSFHKFWHDYSILGAESEAIIDFRLAICQAVGNTLRSGMGLLGIEMPERM